MAKNNKILVPEARNGLDQLKIKVMESSGYAVDQSNPGDVKFEVANELGIPLNQVDNGDLTSGEAGKIGGPIGGNMVKEMIKMAQQQLAKKEQ